MKKKAMIPLLILLLVVFAYGGWYLRSAMYPRVDIGRAVPGNSTEDKYLETILVAYGENDVIPMAKKVSKQLEELQNWNMESYNAIYGNLPNGPYHITVSGEIADGKTTLRYEGYYTSENGNITELLFEKTFDFVMDKTLFDSSM